MAKSSTVAKRSSSAPNSPTHKVRAYVLSMSDYCARLKGNSSALWNDETGDEALVRRNLYANTMISAFGGYMVHPEYKVQAFEGIYNQANQGGGIGGLLGLYSLFLSLLSDPAVRNSPSGQQAGQLWSMAQQGNTAPADWGEVFHNFQANRASFFTPATASRITSSPLPPLDDGFNGALEAQADAIITDPFHQPKAAIRPDAAILSDQWILDNYGEIGEGLGAIGGMVLLFSGIGEVVGGVLVAGGGAIWLGGRIGEWASNVWDAAVTTFDSPDIQADPNDNCPMVDTSGSGGGGSTPVDGISCFPGGTLITMADRSRRPVELLTVGSKVLSGQTDGQFGSTVSVVKRVTARPGRPTVRLLFQDDTILRVAKDHDFVSASLERLPVRFLTAGSELPALTRSQRLVRVEQGPPATTYQLALTGSTVIFVGENGIAAEVTKTVQ